MPTPQPTAAELIRMHQELPGLKRMLRELQFEVERTELILNGGRGPLQLEGEVVSHTFDYATTDGALKIVPEATAEQRAAFVHEPQPAEKARKKKIGSASKNYWARMTQEQRKAEMKRRQQVHARKLRRGG